MLDSVRLFSSNTLLLNETLSAAARYLGAGENVPSIEQASTPDTADITLDTYSTPIKIGTILFDIQKLIKNRAHDRLYKLGAYELSPHSLDLKHTGGGADIRLTEKERDILLFLLTRPPEQSIVTREMLLKHVWRYADTVETHTLETHIYRLRQKIEDDPSSPKILITKDDGYMLSSD